MSRRKARCYDCGQVVPVYTPKAGDGSVDVYSLHREDGLVCNGSKAAVEKDDYGEGAPSAGGEEGKNE